MTLLRRADNRIPGRTRATLRVALIGALLTWNGVATKAGSLGNFSRLLFPVAHAEQNGGCQNCQGGGQGGEGGGQAADILLGIAAIIAPIAAAVAQVAAAEKQAEADKFIAKTAADASITQTKIQADVTKQLSDNQRQLSEKNLEVTQQLAREQEEARQERVNLQLSALQQERKAQEEERREIRAIEQERIDQQIAFAKQQADENLRLAKLSINTQLITQGLATGVAPSGSRGRLTTTASGATGGSSGFGSSVAQRAIASVDAPSTAIKGSSGSGSPRASAPALGGFNSTIPSNTRGTKPQLAALGTAPTASNKLIRAVKNETLSGKAMFVSGRGASSSRIAGLATGFQFNGASGDGPVPGLTPQLGQQMQVAGLVRGSTRGLRQLTEEAKEERDGKGSDLNRFLSTVRSDAVWRGSRPNGGSTTGIGNAHQDRGVRR